MKKRGKSKDLPVRVLLHDAGRPTLVETVDLSATLKVEELCGEEALQNFREMLADYIDTMAWKDGDTIEVNYTFNMEYFGRVEERIRAWIELIRSGAIVKADFHNLTEARVKSLLIVELMDKLIEELRR